MRIAEMVMRWWTRVRAAMSWEPWFEEEEEEAMDLEIVWI
jgi:hypothetical protein